MSNKTMAVWIIGMALLAAIIVSPVACTMNRQMLVAEAIKGGKDPIAVKCAIESSVDDGATSSLCLAKALVGGIKQTP